MAIDIDDVIAEQSPESRAYIAACRDRGILDDVLCEHFERVLSDSQLPDADG